MENTQEKDIKKGKLNKFKKVINITSIIMFISFLFLSWSFTIIVAKNIITNIFASSLGWNFNVSVISNQLVAPFIGFVNNTAINNIIKKP